MDNQTDVLGIAYKDYLEKGKNAQIIVQCSMAEDEKLPVSYFFRDITKMPEQEILALELCKGKVLDVGAGAGCHSLELQKKGFEVMAIDISELGIEVMKKRGVKDCYCKDIYSLTKVSFDTILFLMNGIGMAKTISGLKDLFMHVKSIMNKDAQVFIESSDISYLLPETGIDLNAEYFGEIEYTLKYKGISGTPFQWLYIDYSVLSMYAEECGFKCELLYASEEGNYLCRLVL
ncbi:MAG: methyltransferase domain-containing protein [Bacteroidota bacterium]